MPTVDMTMFTYEGIEVSVNNTNARIDNGDPTVKLTIDTIKAYGINVKSKYIIAQSFLLEGGYYENKGDFSLADSSIRVAIELLESLNLNDHKILKEIGNCYNSLGNLYQNNNLNLLALNNYLIADSVYSMIGWKLGLSKVKNNIATIYIAEENIDFALRYLFDNIKIFESASNKEKSSPNYFLKFVITYANIGDAYVAKKMFPEAFGYYDKSKLLIEKNGSDSFLLAHLFSSIGSAYGKQGDYLKAEYFLSESFNIRQIPQYANSYGTATLLVNLGQLKLDQRKFKEGINILLRGLNIAQKERFPAHIENINFVLASIYDSLSQYDSAYHYLRRYVILHDSITNTRSDLILSELQTKYNTDVITLENEIKTKKLQDSIFNQRVAWVFVYLSLFIAIIVSIYYIKLKRSSLRRKEEIILLSNFKTEMTKVIDNIKQNFPIISNSSNLEQNRDLSLIQGEFNVYPELISNNFRAIDILISNGKSKEATKVKKSTIATLRIAIDKLKAIKIIDSINLGPIEKSISDLILLSDKTQQDSILESPPQDSEKRGLIRMIFISIFLGLITLGCYYKYGWNNIEPWTAIIPNLIVTPFLLYLQYRKK